MFGRPNGAILAALAAATPAATLAAGHSPHQGGAPELPEPTPPDYPDGTAFQVEYVRSCDMFKFSVRRSALLVVPEETIWVPASYVKFAALTLLQSEVAAHIPGLAVAPVAAGSGPQLVPE